MQTDDQDDRLPLAEAQDPAGAEVAPGGPAPGDAAPDGAAAADDPAVPGVSLMITRRQKAALRDLGVSEEEIRHMTPAEAHARLGL